MYFTSLDIWMLINFSSMITMAIVRHTMASWNTVAIFYLWLFIVQQSDIEPKEEIISEITARNYIHAMPCYF